MKRGELVTTTSLTSIFKTIKTRLNEIASVQIAGLSIGQVIGIGVDWATKTSVVCNTVMSSTTEQYFDSTVNIVYALPEDDGALPYGGENFIDYYLEEIRKLEEL